MARSSRLGCARPVLRGARADLDPRRGGGSWAGGRVGRGVGGGGGEPCLRVPAAGKAGAGDFANCRTQPAPRRGTPTREQRQAMLMPRSRRGPGSERRISQTGSPAAESNRWSGLDAWACPRGPAVWEDVGSLLSQSWAAPKVWGSGQAPRELQHETRSGAAGKRPGGAALQKTTSRGRCAPGWGH